MTNGRSNPPRTRWVREGLLNKWVKCLDCDYEYFIESRELNAHCPLCESREYEESTPTKEYLNLDDLDEWI